MQDREKNLQTKFEKSNSKKEKVFITKNYKRRSK
jgi:hypothetical protein